MVLFSLFCVFSSASPFQVALEVEQEEDEAGTIGDTFTDYVSAAISMYHWANFRWSLNLARVTAAGFVKITRVTFYHESPGLRDCVPTYFEGYRWDKGIYGVSDKQRHVAICAETVKAVYRATSSRSNRRDCFLVSCSTSRTYIQPVNRWGNGEIRGSIMFATRDNSLCLTGRCRSATLCFCIFVVSPTLRVRPAYLWW